ncbi:hypothetical protein TSAR_005034 [Trichomalopsis sarcophagae]|uniref:Uncharacterized protein n=1 Tax=Trichomalopsis sarcophagae TaxID=543379 RepID=A0A232FK72_9HYME|nr:hypothetical protein TSAR_005034 [Trichomalopsis sarcophagae]
MQLALYSILDHAGTSETRSSPVTSQLSTRLVLFPLSQALLSQARARRQRQAISSKKEEANLGMKFWGFGLLVYLACLVFLMAATSSAYPAGDPEAAIENMRQIPQWHCLRYRKFDLVRRCRNYRIGRKH